MMALRSSYLRKCFLSEGGGGTKRSTWVHWTARCVAPQSMGSLMWMGRGPQRQWHQQHGEENLPRDHKKAVEAEVETGSAGPRRCYGQATSHTHPHLLRKGELTPGITLEEYAERRHRLAASIRCHPQKASRNVVLIPSAKKTYMTENIPHPFRQNSDFLYLTGFLEPDAILLLAFDGKEDEARTMKSVLFVPPRDPRTEVWDGPRTGANGAVELLGVDEAQEVSMDGKDAMESVARHFHPVASTAVWCDASSGLLPSRLVQMLSDLGNVAGSPRPFLQHHLRLFKSPAELRLMQASCDVACAAMREAVAVTHPGVSERLLHATVANECMARGAERLAYPPVVASGPRATVVHYGANDALVGPEDLVLVDAGCELHGYVSDVTRTWPSRRKPSAAAAISDTYEAVLGVQQRLITACREMPSLDWLYGRMVEWLGEELQRVGLIHKSTSTQERRQLVVRYCPHHVGHFLGMDVHDTPLVSRSIPLRPRMVFTVEPGVYVRVDDPDAPKEMRGMGIRIEDDVTILGDDDHDAARAVGGMPGSVHVLSSGCPKTLEGMEQIQQKTSGHLGYLKS